MLTREAFNRIDQGCGGDCWNDLYCYRKAFEYDDVDAVLRLRSVGTGLWRDVIVLLIDGSIVERRVFG